MSQSRMPRPRAATPAPTAIRRSLHDDAPSLKKVDPAAARWINSLIRLSSPHPAMVHILDVIERLQDRPFRTNFVLSGEPGTGKEGLARALAQLVTAKGPVIRFDVTNFPEDDALAFLCGDGKKSGAAEAADGGFLIIEELTGLGPRVQEALLRVLKSGRIRRRGQVKDLDRKLSVNAIALSDADVPGAVREGRLRHDLYYRLARIPLYLPPLRQRPEDLGPAAVWMGNRILASAGVPLELRSSADLERASEADRRRAIELEPSAVEALRAHPWPGNLRELEATLERALLLYRDGSKVGEAQIRAALNTPR